MLNLSPNTAQISGITVELDTLHKSYLAIFQEAKSQLENIDLTDENLSSITKKLAANKTFSHDIAHDSVLALAQFLKDATDETVAKSSALQGLLDALETRIWQRIYLTITDVISTMVEAQITAAVDKALAESFTNNGTIQRGATALDLINQLQQLATVNEQTTKTTTENNQNSTKS